jgi:hypothetical protein
MTKHSIHFDKTEALPNNRTYYPRIIWETAETSNACTTSTVKKGKK